MMQLGDSKSREAVYEQLRIRYSELLSILSESLCDTDRTNELTNEIDKLWGLLDA